LNNCFATKNQPVNAADEFKALQRVTQNHGYPRISVRVYLDPTQIDIGDEIKTMGFRVELWNEFIRLFVCPSYPSRVEKGKQ